VLNILEDVFVASCSEKDRGEVHRVLLIFLHLLLFLVGKVIPLTDVFAQQRTFPFSGLRSTVERACQGLTLLVLREVKICIKVLAGTFVPIVRPSKWKIIGILIRGFELFQARKSSHLGTLLALTGLLGVEEGLERTVFQLPLDLDLLEG